MHLPAGKLPPELLRGVLSRIRISDPAVLLGGAVGEDAAVIDLGAPELLVAKTDPITFASQNLGDYLLWVNGNDLATMGAEPRWILVTTLLPEKIEEGQAKEILDGLVASCERAGIALVGGHTEITVGLDRPIVVGCLFGTVARDRLVRTSGARVGDAILLAGGIAIEGSALLAREQSDSLLARGVEPDVIERARNWLHDPGISVLPAARILTASHAVHSMHDPTEGGLFTALHELAEAAGVGLVVDAGAIPVLLECARICEALGLDPGGLLASGALLATLDDSEVDGALAGLGVAGIPAKRIGQITPLGQGRLLQRDGRWEPLPAFARDELARYLES